MNSKSQANEDNGDGNNEKFSNKLFEHQCRSRFAVLSRFCDSLWGVLILGLVFCFFCWSELYLEGKFDLQWIILKTYLTGRIIVCGLNPSISIDWLNSCLFLITVAQLISPYWISVNVLTGLFNRNKLHCHNIINTWIIKSTYWLSLIHVSARNCLSRESFYSLPPPHIATT